MSFKEFLDKNHPTIFYIFSLTFSIIFLSIQLVTYYVSTFRSFFLYFFSYTYRPIYNIINYPLEVTNRFVQIPYLYEENLHLKKVLWNFYSYKISYDKIFENFRQLEIYNDVKSFKKYDFCLSTVINRNYETWFNELTIEILNKETKIKEDMPVVVYVKPDKFFFVGRIWSVNNNVAKVLLITNSLSMIPAKIKDKEIYGVAIGNSSSDVLFMDYILLEDDVRIGDVVVTNGINNIPLGIEIGRVIDIQLSETGFKKAVVKLDYNINALKNLLIIAN